MKDNWQIKKLGEVSKIIMGQSPPSDTYNENAKGMPFFQGKAEFTELYPVVKKYCTKPTKIAEPLDILLSVRAPVGTTNIANQQCCIGRGLAAIRFENYKYGFYFLRSIQHELDSKGTGTTFRAISGETIRETLIPFPNPEIQQAIVSKIEELFSELDKGIEDLKTAQQQLKTYRQSVLKWAFEGKLTNENVKDGELPEGWKMVKVSEIAKIETGTTPSKNNPDFYGNEFPFYKPTDLEAGNNVFKSKDGLTELGVKQARYVPEFSTLVTCIGATIGKTGFIKTGGGFNQQINAIVPNDAVNPLFVYYQTIGLSFQKQIIDNSSATTLPIINKSKFQILRMVLCNLNEQHQIVQEIESRLSVADKMEESIAQSLQQAEALRQSILKKAFSGELV